MGFLTKSPEIVRAEKAGKKLRRTDCGYVSKCFRSIIFAASSVKKRVPNSGLDSLYSNPRVRVRGLSGAVGGDRFDFFIFPLYVHISSYVVPPP